MNADQLGGVVRAVVPPFLAYAIAKGWLVSADVAPIVTAVVAAATAVWSYFTNKPGTVIPTK